jgi:hypothetical protein
MGEQHEQVLKGLKRRLQGGGLHVGASFFLPASALEGMSKQLLGTLDSAPNTLPQGAEVTALRVTRSLAGQAQSSVYAFVVEGVGPGAPIVVQSGWIELESRTSRILGFKMGVDGHFQRRLSQDAVADRLSPKRVKAGYPYAIP